MTKIGRIWWFGTRSCELYLTLQLWEILNLFQNINSKLAPETIPQSDLNEDIFSSPPDTRSSNLQFFLPQVILKEPTEASLTFYSEFSLPPVQFPKATMEDCNEDDCDSILGTSPDDISSMHSITSDKTGISSDHSVHMPSNSDIPNGQIQMVPSMLMAQQALLDVNIFLCSKSKGKGGGYHAPKLDPFIWSRMEGIHTFLNLFMIQIQLPTISGQPHLSRPPCPLGMVPIVLGSFGNWLVATLLTAASCQ